MKQINKIGQANQFIVLMIFILGILTIFSIALYFGVEKYNPLLIVELDRGVFVIDINDSFVEIASGTSEPYAGVYGAYALFVNNEFKGYWSYYTNHNDDRGKLNLYQNIVKFNEHLKPGENVVQVYYDVGSIRDDVQQKYVSNICGSLGGPFPSQQWASYGEMVKKYAVCTVTSFGNVAVDYKWVGDTCYLRDQNGFADLTKPIDENYCLKVSGGPYTGITNITENDITKIKSWNFEKQKIYLPESESDDYVPDDSVVVAENESWWTKLVSWITGWFK